ncbi:MAG TPA: hypothetical protein ENJ62_05465 [Bryobacterales bacterium]|nr:hypothetical protein [Bryobacterales bacterium]
MSDAKEQGVCPTGGSCATGTCARSSGAPLLVVAILLAGLGLLTGETSWLWLAAMAAGSAALWWLLVFWAERNAQVCHADASDSALRKEQADG